jgi:hypothetical protein
VRSFKQGYWKKSSEDIKYQIFEEQEWNPKKRN